MMFIIYQFVSIIFTGKERSVVDMLPVSSFQVAGHTSIKNCMMLISHDVDIK